MKGKTMKCKHCDNDAEFGIETIEHDPESCREWEYINYVCAQCADSDRYEELERMSAYEASGKWGTATSRRID